MPERLTCKPFPISAREEYYTYPPNYGQEAIAIAAGQVMRKEDWMVPAFREFGALLAKGVSLKEVFLYFMGYEDGSIYKDAHHVLPMSVPIASQLLHGVGIGYEIKYRKKDEVVFAFVGDGGTSEGDFHEAVNFAGVWNVPVIFIVQNNQYGISTPFRMQTASDGIAIKSVAYGVRGIQVDGNDYFAMHAALSEAAKQAREGKRSQRLLKRLPTGKAHIPLLTTQRNTGRRKRKWNGTKRILSFD